MIRRLIFDLDNTLIMWNDEYDNALDKALNYFNIDYDENVKNSLLKVIIDYEDKYDIYNYDYIIELMRDYTNINLPYEFVEKWFEYLAYAVPSDKDLELIDALEYLSSKYELVVLTNWFTKSQKERLKNYEILKYFKEVIGTDLVKNKPNEEAFIKACGPYKPLECVMIGDSLEKDVNGALNCGLNAILFDYKDKYDGEIQKVKKISDLKNIL